VSEFISKQATIAVGRFITRNGCCIKTSVRVELRLRKGNSLTVQRDRHFIQHGARDRRCTMRDEFASKSFLVVTVAGLVLLCSGLVAIAFT
jgi:hypothetical protein